MKILLARPRGFCAGVEYAIGIVKECLELFPKPIYILREIVHNKHIVRELAKEGALSVDAISEVPEGEVLVFSAHGVPPEFHAQAKSRNLKIIDATCPLVRKVHLEAVRFAKEGYHILYIGHEGHDEAIGVLAECPDSITLLETTQDALDVAKTPQEKIAYLTQTTLSVDETQRIIEILQERFPEIQAPSREDICYATTNRQFATKELAKSSDLVFVIGSTNSSNSQRLRECAAKEGSMAYLIDAKESIQREWLQNINSIGITAGASAPEDLVQEVVSYLQEIYPDSQIEELELIKESTVFPIPQLT